MPTKRGGTKKRTIRQGVTLRRIVSFPAAVWRRGLFYKSILILSAFVILLTSGMYGIAQWYIFQHRDDPYRLGVTFIPQYASYLGVDPVATLRAIQTDLKPAQLRLVSYWDEIEAVQGTYNFSNLDWQMRMAEEFGTDVSLAIGLRQPRWPECHMPQWAATQEMPEWYPHLKRFMEATINRYKDSPVLKSYQLENEFFLDVFGICPDFSRERLVDEYEFVKTLDPARPVIVNRSNNAIGFPINEPVADVYGVSVYKRVWDKTVTKRYIEYPFPAWFYGFLAGGSKLLQGRELIIHELQAEAWTPEGYEIATAPVEELQKSMNPERLRKRFAYAKASGIKYIDLWGAEWWYSMKQTRDRPELWDTAVDEFSKARLENLELRR